MGGSLTGGVSLLTYYWSQVSQKVSWLELGESNTLTISQHWLFHVNLELYVQYSMQVKTGSY